MEPGFNGCESTLQGKGSSFVSAPATSTPNRTNPDSPLRSALEDHIHPCRFSINTCKLFEHSKKTTTQHIRTLIDLRLVLFLILLLLFNQSIVGNEMRRNLLQFFDTVPFVNTFTKEVIADPLTLNQIRQVPSAMFSYCDPTPLEAPKYHISRGLFLPIVYEKANTTSVPFELMIASDEVARECFGVDLDRPLTKEDLQREDDKNLSQHFVNVLAGYDLLPQTKYYAHAYGGHQFGYYAGQLGDGRAISLGQIQTNGQLWELQLKGAGPTPYSRNADGRAVLRSSIREFLASEHMYHLNIATTRAFSLVRSEEKAVIRDEFYNRNPKYEHGAIVMRLAPTFVRFGSFEVFYYRYNSEQAELQKKEHDNIDVLTTYVIKNHYAHLLKDGNIDNSVRVSFAKEVVRRTAKLMADWMSVGFVHGVMNTDNMSILGVTIDYGPFGYQDYFSEQFVPNNSDDEGRYSYKNQPAIGFWDCQKFVRALTPIFETSENYTSQVLAIYGPHFEHFYLYNFRGKLGLLPENHVKVTHDLTMDVTDWDMFVGDSADLRETDWELIESLLEWMNRNKADFTISFRLLSDINVKDINANNEVIGKLMDALEAAPTGYEAEEQLKTWLSKYQERNQHESIVSEIEQRKERMDKINPRYILRNFIAQEVIKAADEDDDFGPLYEYYQVLKNPFDNQSPEIETKYGGKAPLSAKCLKLSCSS